MEDEQVSVELARLLQGEGLRVVLDAAIERVSRNEAGRVTLSLTGGDHSFDEVLVATGRKAQVPLGLEELGLELDGRGFVQINSCGRTNLPGLWAAGDVTGKFLFTHYAAYQAHHIANHIRSGSCETIPDVNVPWAIFTDPEIGHVGLTEAQARTSAGDIRIGYLDASELDWFRTTGRADGFAKVVVDARDGRLLGAHFLCANAATLVGEASLAIAHQLTARDVASTVHPYPTAGELFRWACAKAV
jgi:probable pyridine nucleotide-disulfide oxidoreductase